MQVMETNSEDKNQPNLITHVKVEAANESDSNAQLFMTPLILLVFSCYEKIAQ